MASKSELQIVINADDKASKKVGNVRKAFQGLGKAAKVAGKALKLASVAIASVGAGMAAAVHEAAKFEGKMREVNTLVNLGDKQFKGLTDQMLELSKQTGVATEELAGGLYQAISAGVPADNALDFMTVASKAAIGGVTEVETAIDGLTTVVNAFGLEASEVEKVSDVLFTTVKLGKTTMQELSTALFQAAPLAASLGLSIEDVAGATASLTKAGVPTTVAMTQIRAAMVALTKPTASMEDIFAQMGVATGKAALETFGFQGTLEKLVEVTGGSETAIVSAMGRVEGFSAVLGLTGKNAAVARADLEAMAKAGGATQTAFDEMNKSFQQQFGILKNQLSVQLQKTGLRLIPKLIPIIQRLSGAYDEWTELGDMVRRAWAWFRKDGDFVGALSELEDKYPKVTKKLIAFYLGAMEIKRVAGELVERFRALVGAGGPLQETFNNLFGVITVEGTKYIQNLIEFYQTLWNLFVESLPAIKAFGQALLNVVTPAYLNAWATLVKFILRMEAARISLMTSALERLSSIFSGTFVPALQQAWGFLELLGGVIVDVVKPAIDDFIAALVPAQEQIAGLSDEFAVLRETIGPAFQAALGILGATLLGLVGLVTAIVAAIIKTFAEVLPFIIKIVEGGIVAFTGFLNFIRSFWKILQGLFSGNQALLKQGFEDLKNALLMMWEGMWMGITAAAEGFWVGLNQLVSSIIDGVIAFFETLQERLIGGSIIPEMLAAMTLAFTTWFADISKALGMWVSETLADFQAFFDDLKKRMSEWFDARLDDIEKAFVRIVELFRNGWENVKDTATGVMESIAGHMRSFIGTFESIGEDLVRGLAAGILMKAEDIVNAITATIEDMISAARSALDAFSPSRVMIDVGQNVVESMAKGIEESIPQVIPQVENAAAFVPQAFESGIIDGFQIRSPSKVMMGLATETVKGWIIGLKRMTPASQAMMGLVTGSALAPNMRSARVPQSIDRSRTINYNLTAQYRNEQSEARLVDDLSLLAAVTGGR